MTEQHPDILYKLSQFRAHDFQQRAANFRLAADVNRTAPSLFWQKLAQLGDLLAKAPLIFIEQAEKPAPDCC